MHDALPIHTTSLRIVLEEIARTFEGRVNDGDVFMCNDPYRGNTHLGDVVTALPVFIEGELRFWSVTKGHQLDIGGYLPSSVIASARNVWKEGLTIPPIKIHDRGEPRDDIIDLGKSTRHRFNDSDIRFEEDSIIIEANCRRTNIQSTIVKTFWLCGYTLSRSSIYFPKVIVIL